MLSLWDAPIPFVDMILLCIQYGSSSYDETNRLYTMIISLYFATIYMYNVITSLYRLYMVSSFLKFMLRVDYMMGSCLYMMRSFIHVMQPSMYYDAITSFYFVIIS